MPNKTKKRLMHVQGRLILNLNVKSGNNGLSSHLPFFSPVPNSCGEDVLSPKHFYHRKCENKELFLLSFNKMDMFIFMLAFNLFIIILFSP